MSKPKDIAMKRAYDAAAPEDGYRALVDRLTPGCTLLDVTEFEEGGLPRRLWRITLRRSEAPAPVALTVRGGSRCRRARRNGGTPPPPPLSWGSTNPRTTTPCARR